MIQEQTSTELVLVVLVHS